jgi:hypothetical protein
MRRCGRRSFTLALPVALLLGAVAETQAQQALGSPHGRLPVGLACTSCHTTEAWSPLRQDVAFDHAGTGFPLDGRHADATCARCHAGLGFDAVDAQPGECASCHVDVHEGGITRPCASCHSTLSFSDLDFGTVHPADFPLEGAHLQTSCESCHTDDLGGAFRALDTECVTCHMGDYVSSSLVDHQRLGFSTDCTECHSALDFRDVAFDHFIISGGFELMGRHAGIECVACHSGPDGGVPVVPADADECVACHRSDYDREHRGSGFPTDCLACHTPFDWDGASFDHSFPIFSGAHGGAWDACADCHEVPGDYLTFTCLGCHLQPQMDDKHRERAGYAYDSPTCLSCHPTGRHE